MTTELVTIPGTEVELQAQLVDGEPYVIFKPMCDSLSLGYEAQREKLAGADWAVTRIILATGADGKNYRMFSLHVDCVPMWLATINTTKVSPEARPVLIALQKEAARALRDHFYRGVSVQSGANHLDVLQGMLDQFRANEQRMNAHEVVIGDHANRLEALEGETGWSTTLGYCKRHGISNPPGFTNRLGVRARRIGTARGIEVRKVPDRRYGQVNMWPDEVLAAAVVELHEEGLS